MKRSYLRVLLPLPIILGVSPLSYGADPLSELRHVVTTVKTPEQQQVVQRVAARRFVDCSKSSLGDLSNRPKVSMTQYIYNSSYHWSQIDTLDGQCIYMMQPFNRGLTIEEATDFLVASLSKFPVDQSTQESNITQGVMPKPLSGDDKNAVIDLSADPKKKH